MRIYQQKNNTIIEGINDFNLEQTLECGQCFRFYKQNDNEYVVVAYEKLIHVKQEDDNLIFFNNSIEEVENIWIHYFDLKRDYGKIKNFLLRNDKKLEPAIKEKYGVRILNQQFHEMLISFNISLRLSPYPGALTATTLNVPRNLFTISVVRASPSTSSAIIKSFAPDCTICSSTGRIS